MGYAFDRLGRQIVVTNGATVCAWTYNDANQPLTESYTGGALAGLAITNGYYGLLRRTQLSILNSPSSILSAAAYTNCERAALNVGAWSQGYAYDAARRPTGLVSPAGTFGCGCDPVRLARVSRVTLPNTAYIVKPVFDIAQAVWRHDFS